MAQNITLLGASYTGVPSVILPKTGGGTASFTDVTDTTASAADVAAGKWFYTSGGVLTEGTASGGGGGAPLALAMRPDAECIKTWTYNKLIHEDEGITIPAYTTTSTVLKASESLSDDTVTVDLSTYGYFMTQMLLTVPIYSNTTAVKGRQEYFFTCGCYEMYDIPANTAKALSANKYANASRAFTNAGSMNRLLYWSSATALNWYTSSGYGAAQTIQLPNFTSGTTITVKTPTFTIRGSTSYLTQTAWNALTDIRYQYKFQLWRAPISSGVHGWGMTSEAQKILDDVVNNGGILS